MKLEELQEEINKHMASPYPLVARDPMMSRHIIHLLDPVTGTVERRTMGPDSHLGGVEEY